jgi:predicted DNA-binding protein
MLSIQLDPETEKRLSELARRTGRSEDDCACELIEEHIDDLEDRYVAELRLRKRQPLRASPRYAHIRMLALTSIAPVLRRA